MSVASLSYKIPAYPEERLIACRNPQLALAKGPTSVEALLEATAQELEKLCERVGRGALKGAATIGLKVGRVLDKYKVGKHFHLYNKAITHLGDERRERQIAAEAALDGIYVIRTGLKKKQMSAAEAVRSYKFLAQVERAFRSLKTVDLKIRPIHHWLEKRVRAHIFLCMLAYYVDMASARGVARAPLR